MIVVDTAAAPAAFLRASAGQVPPDASWTALRVWQRLGVTRYPAFSLLHRVWELRENVSAYDATYVALAEFLGCPLLTADGRLARAAGVQCVTTVVPN